MGRGRGFPKEALGGSWWARLQVRAAQVEGRKHSGPEAAQAGVFEHIPEALAAEPFTSLCTAPWSPETRLLTQGPGACRLAQGPTSLHVRDSLSALCWARCSCRAEGTYVPDVSLAATLRQAEAQKLSVTDLLRGCRLTMSEA